MYHIQEEIGTEKYSIFGKTCTVEVSVATLPPCTEYIYVHNHSSVYRLCEMPSSPHHSLYSYPSCLYSIEEANVDLDRHAKDCFLNSLLLQMG